MSVRVVAVVSDSHVGVEGVGIPYELVDSRWLFELLEGIGMNIGVSCVRIYSPGSSNSWSDSATWASSGLRCDVDRCR